MRHTANESQAAAWNGEEGAHWASQDDTGPALDDHLFALARIGDRDRVLDVGCGTGATTRIAAGHTPHGFVVGLDLSEPMVARARTEASKAGLRNVTFEVGDAEVHRLPERGFDVAISRFGIMFFADPVAAFTNIRSALRHGGRLVFVCPGDPARCDWYQVPLTALLGRGPEAVAPGSPGMFSLGDPDRTRRLLRTAGFDEVVIEPLTLPMEFGPDADAAAEFFVGTGPVRAVLDRRPELTVEDARRTLTTALRDYESAKGVRLTGSNWLVEASQ